MPDETGLETDILFRLGTVALPLRRAVEKAKLLKDQSLALHLATLDNSLQTVISDLREHLGIEEEV